MKEAKIQIAKLKDDINGINYKLGEIKNGTISAQASKAFELKKSCEEISDLKNEVEEFRKNYIHSIGGYILQK